MAGIAAGLWTGDGFSAPLPAAVLAQLTPEQEQGPFYIDAERIRQDIREGRPGVPLELRMALVHAVTGAPLLASAIDIWHCDAGGIYSGFAAMGRGGPPGGGSGDSLSALDGQDDMDRLDDLDGQERDRPSGFRDGKGGGGPHLQPTNASRFLRGVQLTDGQGIATFTTIYPGWYAGREIHIHLKVHLGGSVKSGGYAGGHVCHTGQLFFPDETNAAISRTEPYAASRTPRTPKADDSVYGAENGARSIVAIGRHGPGYRAEITLAVDPSAEPPPVAMT